jgi:hypothetical protein
VKNNSNNNNSMNFLYLYANLTAQTPIRKCEQGKETKNTKKKYRNSGVCIIISRFRGVTIGGIWIGEWIY